MQKYQFLDENGSFELEKAEGDYGFYFPLASETGLKSAITPNLGGDSKLDQNHFLMEPVSIENLNNNKSGRNFWCRIKGEEPFVWSAVGNSAAAELLRFSEGADESKIQAGYMWHKQMRTSKEAGLSAEVTTFIPYNANIEITKVTITNKGSEKITFVPTAVMPIYGRSADNIRDHR
ncbi:MAG: cellobiose phosphorylase, partial [Parasporobacterium sp.]|nr:cellobiose phosphorylase [Parasporobacterium sp.]